MHRRGVVRRTTLLLQAAPDRPFIVFGPGKDAIWSGDIWGGTLPYHVRVNWGDGAHNDYTIEKAGKQAFRHHYTVMRPHEITLRVTDADGRAMTLYFVAVTPYVPPANIFGSTGGPPNNSRLFGYYGAYLLALAAAGFIWIGARRKKAYVLVPVAPSRPFTQRYNRSYGRAHTHKARR